MGVCSDVEMACVRSHGTRDGVAIVVLCAGILLLAGEDGRGEAGDIYMVRP